MEEVEALADIVIIMKKSHIVATGTPLSLRSYRNEYRMILNTLESPKLVKPPIKSALLEFAAKGEVVWRIKNKADLSIAISWAQERVAETLRNNRFKLSNYSHNTRPLSKLESHIGVRIESWNIAMNSLEDVLLDEKLFKIQLAVFLSL